MTFQKNLIILSICAGITACGSSNNNTTITVEPSTLVLSMPNDDAMLQEDFPISHHLTYTQNQPMVDGITSIDVNWPDFDVYQVDRELGYIDGESMELFYSVHEPVSDPINKAVDLERQDQDYWFVNGDTQLHRLNKDSRQLLTWDFANTELTELSIDQDDASQVWLYSISTNQLIHFNSELEQTTRYQITDNLTVQGLSLTSDTLLILGNSANKDMVFKYQVSAQNLTPMDAWYVEGFSNKIFNDISLMPDNSIALSTTGSEDNIFLVVDRSEFLGAGPIEDDGELILVTQHPLDTAINQPSGLWAMDDGTWLVITDQAETFTLDENFQLQDSINLSFDSINCNQGCTEAVVGYANGFYALTDSGLIGQFERVNGEFELIQEFQINVLDEDGHAYQFSGLAKNALTNEFYLVSSQNGEREDILIVLNSDFSIQAQHSITYDGESSESIYEFDAQGVYYDAQHLYIVSEQYTKVLQMSLTGEIVNVFDLDPEDLEIPSDIVVKDGYLYLTGDHENDDPTPPISVFELTYF